uniref:protein-cysteine N-palmitoyltransferase HHAT n=1 Tax=Panthera onca TaxID=9690 RepID=UPI002953A3D2|nr:protein-cysteine N-palmitoyltransferase HHAT [Panthera onca]
MGHTDSTKPATSKRLGYRPARRSAQEPGPSPRGRAGEFGGPPPSEPRTPETRGRPSPFPERCACPSRAARSRGRAGAAAGARSPSTCAGQLLQPPLPGKRAASREAGRRRSRRDSEVPRGLLGTRGARERRRRCPGQPGEHEEELDRQFDLEAGTLFGGFKKDPNDFEWSFWMEWGKQQLVRFLLGHIAVSQVAGVLARKHRPWILGAYGMWASWCVLGAQGTAIIFLHTLISFCMAQFQSQLLSWLCSLFLLTTLRLQDVEEVKRGWYQTENEYYLLQFTLTVRCLYYTSFSLEFCWQETENSFYSFPWLVAYVFYYPVFHNGPILSFPEFITQMQQQEYCSLKSSLSAFALGLGRLLCYWWLAELMVHLMYMHAIYSSAPLLRAVSCWTLGGLALAQVIFFYLKYLVLFGVPALLMRLDGLTPPPLPRCVSTMFSFTGMWRYFDVGLHDFLIRCPFSQTSACAWLREWIIWETDYEMSSECRYVYIPVGGSQHGLLRTLFATAVTFAFVSFWHGGHDYLWYWAALNWLGVVAENTVQRLVQTPCIQDSLAGRT